MAQKAKKPIIKLLLELYHDPDRKPGIVILKDLVSLTLYHRTLPRHYFSRYLFKKDRLNIRDYYPDKFLYYGIKPFLNDKELWGVLENKLFFHLYYDQFGIPLPGILMYNHKTSFTFNGKQIRITDTEGFKSLLRDLFAATPALDSMIIKKSFWSYGGDKVYKLFRSQVADNSPVLAELYREVSASGFLFQETVIQHKRLNELNPSCLNTLRIDTYMDKEGKVEIISAYIRMSINNSHVDNISSGGCQVGIDLKTGILREEGHSSFRYYGVKELKSHPITGTLFKDFVIPCFDKAKILAVEAAGLIPGLRIVGWDVAIGEHGPVLIEGNADYAMRGNDLSERGYRTNPVFRKILDELKSS